MNFPNSSNADQLLFVDRMNVAGHRIKSPTWADFLSLESNLKSGVWMPFSLQRESDRDAGLDVQFSDGIFAIVGMEDSRQRGTFGFCLIDLKKTSKMIEVGLEQYPEYCTTSNVDIVMVVARTYFQTGDLDRSVCWHVARQGIGRKMAEIPGTEILPANDNSVTLITILSRL